MRAVVVAHPGGPEVLSVTAVPVPEPGPDDLLVRMAGAGVNRADLMQRAGAYPPPPDASPLLGLEVAGTVARAGERVSAAWPVGTPVCALVAGGGYAEYCVARAAHALPVPDGWSMVEAAGLPEAAFTVWYNVVTRCRLAAGEWLLVHGGTSGIGVFAIQLARALGARVITTVGSDEKAAAALQLGADRTVCYRSEDFVAAARGATGGRGVDVVLDMVGGDYVARNLAALAPDGRLANIAFMQGSTVTLDLAPVMMKRLTVTGSTMRRLPVPEKGAVAAALREGVVPLATSGAIRPVIDSTFPLERAADAHRRMAGGWHIGKIVLTV